MGWLCVQTVLLLLIKTCGLLSLPVLNSTADDTGMTLDQAMVGIKFTYIVPLTVIWAYRHMPSVDLPHFCEKDQKPQP